ncbi:MAG: hypothetical protein CMI74_04385 [Candidatus Pelagibacter sp.]|nr:hypothetical protein [Candidatus Pelagibacter sp.]
MATIIQIKRSSGTTSPSTLKLGEAAYTFGTGTQGNGGDRLYLGTGGVDGNGDANSIDIIGGKYFTALLDHVAGTLTANSALIADANKAIDEVIVGNSASTGGTIKINEGTNNGTNFVGLKAPNAMANTVTFTLPGGDGSAGQFLKTDGAGNLDFQTVNQFIDLAGDSGTDTYNTAETLTFAGGSGMQAVVTDNTVTINATALTNSNLSGSAAISNANLANPTLTLGSSTLTLGATTTDIAGLTSLVVDDITINGQTVQTTASNKDINLSPHGTGTVIVPSGYEDRAGFQSQSLANKAYVDQVAQGLDTKPSCRVGTTANLSASYSNGTAGVGATLTNSGSQAALAIDGVTLSVNDRVLVKDQTNAAHNGIYVVTTAGDGSTNWVITRATPEDQPSELSGGAFVFVEEGTANGDNGYVFTHNGLPTFGTTDLDVAQFSGAGQVIAGAGLVKSGNTIDANTDNSSIEVSSDQLRVKALGITNSMLAGSIDGAKIENFKFTDESSTQGAVEIGNPMEFITGEGINTIASGNTLRIEGELASTSNIGVAKFASDNFTVSTGNVTVTGIDGGTY